MRVRKNVRKHPELVDTSSSRTSSWDSALPPASGRSVRHGKRLVDRVHVDHGCVRVPRYSMGCPGVQAELGVESVVQRILLLCRRSENARRRLHVVFNHEDRGLVSGAGEHLLREPVVHRAVARWDRLAHADLTHLPLGAEHALTGGRGVATVDGGVHDPAVGVVDRIRRIVTTAGGGERDASRQKGGKEMGIHGDSPLQPALWRGKGWISSSHVVKNYENYPIVDTIFGILSSI